MGGFPVVKDSAVQTALSPIDLSQSLINKIYDTLVDAIATDRLQPGSRLNQRELAETFKVSRQPVSHALHRLKSSGLAIESGSKGLVVAPIDTARLIDLYDLRAEIEGLVAERAAKNISLGIVDKSELKNLASLLSFGKKITKTTSVADCIDADVNFHSCLSRICGSDVIIETIEPLWPHFRRSMGRVLMNGAHRKTSWHGHTQIADAVLAGDMAEARKLMHAHIHDAKLFILEKIQSA